MSNDLLGAYSHTFNKDLARPYLFDVNIPIPPIMLNDNLVDIQDTKSLAFSCESAQLPGRAFATTTQKIYGPILKFPVLTSYDNIRLTFICQDKDFFQKKFFDYWFEYINPKDNYNFSYKDDGYIVNITISQYSLIGDLLYKVKLIDAFPIDMSDLALNWEDTSSHKLIIDFAYTRWEIEEVSSIDITNTATFGLGDLIDAGIRAADFGYNVNNALNSGSTLTAIGVIASALPSLGISNFNLSKLTSKFR